MLTGRKFKLERATLALTTVEGRRRAITIPVGAIVKVVSDHPTPGDRLIDVLWEWKTIEMFAVDVDVRGTEIVEYERRDLSASA
jgi:hypothetical protein